MCERWNSLRRFLPQTSPHGRASRRDAGSGWRAATIAIRNGDAVLVRSDDEILPYHQIAVLLYAEDFALRRPDAARRFMRAYVRAVRFYNGALKGGRLDGPNADEVIAILSEATPIKSPDFTRRSHPPE